MAALDFDPIEEAGRQWRRHWGAASAPPMMAVTSIMRAQQILIARLNEALAPFELSFPRYEALMLLYLSAADRCRSARWARGSAKTVIRSQIQITKAKKTNIDHMTSRNG